MEIPCIQLEIFADQIKSNTRNSLEICADQTGNPIKLSIKLTQRLAGGDLGDRAKLPSALSRTLSRALNITCKNNRRTTVELTLCHGQRSFSASIGCSKGS